MGAMKGILAGDTLASLEDGRIHRSGSPSDWDASHRWESASAGGAWAVGYFGA
jgi:hypothetical protein